MIRAFLLALAVAVAVQISPGATSHAAQYTLHLKQECSANGVAVAFSWSGASPDATEQWVDISLFNNGWQQGTFLGAGPLAATTTSHTWDGLIPNTMHYVRINQRLPNGAFDPSATFYFQTADCPGGVPAGPAAPPSGSARGLLDMIGMHDGSPLGVPQNFDWRTGPVIHAALPPVGWNGLLGWGQVYSDVSQPVPPQNLRIQVGGMTVYGLVNGQWQTLQNVHLVGGSYYHASYAGGAIQAVERNEAGGGVSVTPYPGRPYHFFPSSRVQVPAGLEGVVVAISARLILDNPAGPDTRPEARLMLGAGLDWFKGLAGNTSARGACVGPMIWLTSEYQTFVCHTFRNAGVLQANPPPLQ